ncbi:MAG: hypothetical protein PHI27_13000 [Eubacteriales bacterium]|nr:hypothetical protein [Eubacteriales bacterium]MDD3883140.1 hypothetical protein [Eubacteriales bacterium]MDD4512690.1 hypothetical protein [Eubacteriales bacterium]
MGVKAMLAARKAAMMYQKGQKKEALELYEQAEKEGLTDPKYIIGYSVALLRDGQYEKTRELLVKHQNDPMTPEQKSQVRMNYSVAVWKLGDIDKALAVLEGQFKRLKTGLIYDTLGYLYIEAGLTDKALEINNEALEYDDEDSVIYDNLGQINYRLLNDKKKAKEYFEKAIALKDGQIDTLWFLSRYDIESGDNAAAIKKLKKAAEGRFSPLNFATREMVDAELTRLGAGSSADDDDDDI